MKKKNPSKTRLWLRLLIALSFAAATVGMRLPFASRTLFAWDSANFALALNQYNVAFHQPHPPGYPLYVAIAKLLESVLLDANLSFVVISVAASALAVGVLYLFATHLYDTWVGFISALLMMVSVGFWGYGEVAYPYTFLALFGVVVAWMCWAMWQGHRSLAILSGLILGISGGIRQDTLLFLGPLWLISVWGTGILRFVLSSLVLGLAVVSWLWPAVQLTGGWDVYQEASAEQGYLVFPTSSVLYNGINGIRHNSLLLVHSIDQMFGATALVTIYGLGRFLTFKGLVSDQRLRFLLLWFIPPVLVYTMLHIGEPGYVLSITPVLCIVTAVTIRDISLDVRSALFLLSSRYSPLKGLASAAWAGGGLVAALVVMLLVAWNANAFLRTEGPGRWSEISSIDSIISRQVEYARQYPSGSVVVLAKERYRQMQYYLSDYNVRLLYNEFVPDYASARYTYQIPAGVDTILVLDFGKPPAQMPGSMGGEVVLSDSPRNPVNLWKFQVKPGDTIEYGYDYFGVK